MLPRAWPEAWLSAIRREWTDAADAIRSYGGGEGSVSSGELLVAVRLLSRSESAGASRAIAGSRRTVSRGAWYPDPFEVAEERWWDGGKWTDEVRGTVRGDRADSSASPRPGRPSAADPGYAGEARSRERRNPTRAAPARVETRAGERLSVVPNERQPCTCRDVLTARGRVGSIRLLGARLVRVSCADGVWFLKRAHRSSRAFTIESAEHRQLGSYSPGRWLPGGTFSLLDGTELELRRGLSGWSLRRPGSRQRLASIHQSGVGSAQKLTVTGPAPRGETAQLNLLVLASCAVLMLAAGIPDRSSGASSGGRVTQPR